MALRREERPDEGYWKDFLLEFHQRQREEAAKKGGFANWTRDSREWLAKLGPSKWAYGAGLAYAGVTLGFLLWPREVNADYGPVVPVKHEKPQQRVSSGQLEQLDFSPTTQGAPGEQVF